MEHRVRRTDTACRPIWQRDSALRANIRETPVVPLINEQGEKEKGRNEWHFSWCSFLAGAGQVGWVVWGFESLWMPASLLQDGSQEKLANALFSASRFSEVELHFNKGLAGAPSKAIEAAKDTAMNPSVCGAFALAIVADGHGPAYPGIPDHEPDAAKGRKAADTVHRAMNELRTVASNSGAYVSESNFFESDFEQSYWGTNHARLAQIKKKYDPYGLFFVHNGVGSERWTPDGFTR
jgi:FAD/FMN-containing dehydrogenase